MADYQLLGDTFGYHPSYAAANAAVQNTSQPPGHGQPPPPPHGLGLMPPGGVGPPPVPGQSPYHSLPTPAGSQPRPGYPQSSDPLSMSNKLHQNYPGYGSAPTASISSQYSQNYMPPPPPHGALDSYPGLSMSQASHLAASGGHHSLSSSYGAPPPHQAAMMAAQYSGQRLHSPSSLHTSARHPTMPSQYSPYASSLPNSSSSYHGGSTSELWSSSGQSSMPSHLQQSPFTNFQSPSQSTPGATSNSSQPSSTLNPLHSSSSRTSQFSAGSDYGTSSSSNPYFPNHMSNDPSSTYSTNYGAGSLSSSSQSQPPPPIPPASSSSRSSSTSRSQHQQYNSQLASYNNNSQQQSAPSNQQQQSNQTTNANSVPPAAAVSNSPASRFSHYSSYAPSISSYDPANQARLSPYSTPPANSASQTPNSPQYRSNNGGYSTGSSATSQMPVNSPRRTTTNTASPAGSPMRPTSHTPGPPSVGTSSTQNSNQGSSSFSTNSSNSSHHLPNPTSTGKPSSLQQLEQMVMPHLASGTSSNTSTTASKTNSSSNSTFYPANTSSSPISPSQSQSQSSKLFSHYSSSPSTPSPQFPYHQYPQPNSAQPGASSGWPLQNASNTPMAVSNTHSLKSSGPGSIMQPSLVHSAQHLSSSASNKSHSTNANDSNLITSSAYSPYPNSASTNNKSNDLQTENSEYSQSTYNSSSSSNTHPTSSSSSTKTTSSSSSSSSSLPHPINQNNYMNSSLPPPSSYESMSSQQSKQSSLKNETSSLYDHNKSIRIGDPMTADQSQISNYHSMMQTSAYGGQSMPSYPNHSRYDQPPPPPHSMQSNQYGISSEMSNSSYSASDHHDPSMLYDPYNIDNGLGMPPHQTMSEYRESQANLQQSGGVSSDYPPSDPYAANFDDYDTGGKRKGKGRPKKDNAAPKKERKPRQPRSQSARGRGRGRGSKSMMDHVPLPGMMPPEYGGSPVGYGGAPPPPSSSSSTMSSGPNINDSIDMYGSSNMDMYNSHLSSSASKVPSSNPILPITSSTMNSSVLPSLTHQHAQPPPNSEMLSSPYGPKLTSMPTIPPAMPTTNQSNNHHLSIGPPPPPSNVLSNRSPIPPIPPATTISSPTLISQPPLSASHASSLSNQTNYGSPIPLSDSSQSSYNNYSINDEQKLSNTNVSNDPQRSNLNSIASTPSTATITNTCDNKDLVKNDNIDDNNANVEQTSVSDATTSAKSLTTPASYEESKCLIDSGTAENDNIQDNNNDSNVNDQPDKTSDDQMQSVQLPVDTSIAPSNSNESADIEKYQSKKSEPFTQPQPSSMPNYEPSQSSSIDSYKPLMITSSAKGPSPSSAMYQSNYDNIPKETSDTMSNAQSNQLSFTDQLSSSNNYYDSNYQHPIQPVTNQMDISFNNDTKNLPPGSFTSSTPIPEKPKKKRKSKKNEMICENTGEQLATENETLDGESKIKIKKKRTKKIKAEQSLMDDNTIASIDQDDKTQLSTTTFDINNSSIVDANIDGNATGDSVKAKRIRQKKKKCSKNEEDKSEIIPTINNESIVLTENNDSELTNTTAVVAMSTDASQTVVEEMEVVKKPKVKNRAPKRRLPKLALKFKQNKKRKRGFGSPDNSDLEKTPPPSPSPDDEASIHKRRSARNTKRQRYNDDIDLDLSDEDFMQKSNNDEQSQVMNVQLTEDTMVVEKILSSRTAKREIELEQNDDNNNENKEPQFITVEEFYVKYKNLSYLHCDWKTEEELEKGDRRINQKIRRYRQKKDINVFDFLDEEPFNPDYIEVDRILDVNEIEEIIEEEIEIIDDQPQPEKHDDDNKIDMKPVVIDTNDEKTSDINNGTNSDDAVADNTKPKENDELLIKKEEKSDSEMIDKKVNEDDKQESMKKETDIMNVETKGSSDENESNENVETKDETITVTTKEEMIENKNIDENKDDDTKKTGNENEEKKCIKKQIITKTRLVRHYLVKWRGLSYEESTWELEDDIDDRAKIDQFWKYRNPPPKSEWRIKKKPKSCDWKKLEQSPVYKNGNTLREYQLEGVNWLSFCWHNGQNCILADEMGLGKTIQSITFIQEMVNYGIPYPYLVIVPLSTIGNWQREFETWTELNVVTYHGSSPSRNMIQDYEMYYKNDKNERIPNVYKFQVMITTFEVILTDCIELSSIKWVACIIDEAHRLKNRNCKLLEGLSMLSIDHRVLLTGTPLQNNTEELFSLLHFLEPSQFTSNENFMAEFGDLKTEAQVDKLKAILKPMMLRRLKEDVEKSLAPKEETIIEVELTNVQKKYYRAILERNFQFLSKGGTYANMPNLMNTVMELRKCCIHPFLINGAEEQIIQEFRSTHGNESTLNAIIQASGKLVLIDKLLPRLKENGHRVLIFSQMVRCLDILEDYLCQKRYPFERIDGRVRGNLRQAAIDRFSKPDSDRFVFLLCTRAGGLGINLTAADTVIIFDSDWNPQNDLQAQARCHRIGQKKSVKVYRLICRNTYEREMFDRASLKLGLDKAVLQSINAQKNLTAENQLTKKEIEDLLRKGAYGALMDDDAAGDKFCEEDIDMILQRRTTKIVIESEGKGSTFSKASFATSDNRTDIEIDDPNFWEKWAKKANFDVDELKSRNELIVQEPRRRTQTKRFGADDAVLDISELDTSSEEDESISSRTRGSRNRVPNSKKKRKSRFYDPEHDEDYAQEVGFGWTRSEFFKVEKGLLTYGWGRWDECTMLGKFKRNLSQMDIEDISRVILLFSLQNYKGDEKVKSFILELITPPSEKSSETSDSNNGNPTTNENNDANSKTNRKSKKNSNNGNSNNKGIVKPINEELEQLDWAKSEKYNPDIQMTDETYRKHLLRHANKILLRVRLLAYIKTDIIGDLHEKVFSNTNVKDIPLPYCQPDCEPPSQWWNEEADKSLIIGVYKHGYDRFNMMRQDPSLCFLAICGPPDGAALLAEITAEDDVVKMEDDDEPDTPVTPATPAQESKDNNDANKNNDKANNNENDKNNSGDKEGDETKSSKDDQQPQHTEQNYLPFPTSSEMNNRLRRLVTSYQRNFKKEEARIAQKARHMQRLERLEKFEAAIRERENKKREQAQKKWSRREESDFYRVVSSFGIEYDKKADTYDWTRFRTYAKLEKKLDETLTEYFKAFHAMCKKVVGRKLTEDEENLPISVDPITEERANRCLARIELLNKIRDEILNHPELDERLKLCQTQLDLPEWWIYGQHDKDLLIGAAKYGLNRLDYNLMNDNELSFIEIVRNYEAQAAAEEKAANEKIESENEIRSIINDMINKVSKEMDDSDSINEDSEIETKQPETDATSNYTRPQLKWPRDRVLQIRLENVCLAVEKNEWPTFRNIHNVMPQTTNNNAPSVATADSSPRPSTPCSLSSASQETPHPTPDHTPRHETQSPFTPNEYFYPPNPTQSGQIINNNLDDSIKKRRRRGRRYENDNEKTKLHSLLNSSVDQPSHQSSSASSSNINNNNNNNNNNNKSNSNITASTSSNMLTGQNNSNSNFAASLFKNSKTSNSLLNNIPSQFLAPLLNNLPFNIRSTLREELLNDDKATSLLFGPSFQSTLAAAVANVTKAQQQPKSNVMTGMEATTASSSASSSKGNIPSSGLPPPAHQSSSRNPLSLGSLDLTSKFKSATTAVLEKTNTSSTRSANLGALHSAHKQPSKNSNEKADVLDLSSVPCKSNLIPSNSNISKSNTMATILSQTLKKPNLTETSTSSTANTGLPVGGSTFNSGGGGKKRGKIGSRIDALALNLQAKKMMEEVKQENNPVSAGSSASFLSNKFPTSQPTTVPNAATVSTTSNLSKNLFNEKDLLAAFNSLSQQTTTPDNNKRMPASNALFEELSKSPLFHSVKKNTLANLAQQQQPQQPSPASNPLASKKPLAASDVSKAYYNMMESLKLLSKQSPSKQQTSSSTADKNPPIDSKTNLMKQNLKSLLEDNPDLLSQSSTFLSIFNNPLFAQSFAQTNSQQLTSNLNFNQMQSTSSTLPPPPVPNIDEKAKNTRSNSKRTRSQFEQQQPPSSSSSNQDESIIAKRSLLNVPAMSSLIDSKKYLSSLLEKNATPDLKNLIKDKQSASSTSTQASFKTPTVSSHSGSSSIRTRTSEKRGSSSQHQQSSSNVSNSTTLTSNRSITASANNSSTNFPNLNASNLLNNLSLAAAAATSGTPSNKQQQQASSSLLANSYMNALNASGGKSNPGFPNFPNLGFNNNMLSGIPSMKLFLDAAAAAAAAATVSKATSSSTNSTNTNTITTAPSSTTTTSTAAPSLSSFANLFGLNNPLFNFSNFSNLANLNQSSANKKDGASTNLDFASLANSLASSAAAAASNLNTMGSTEDKSKSTSSSNKNSASNSGNNSKSGKNPLSSNLLGTSGGTAGGLPSSSLPFLYSNPNFSMPSLYPFGLTSPFLNNPNLMNGLANFSNVFTSTTTSTPTSSISNASQKSKLSSSSSSSNKGNHNKSSSMMKSPNTSSSSSRSSSSMHLSAKVPSASTTLESDDESIKSLMANEEDDGLNGGSEYEENKDSNSEKNSSRSSKNVNSKRNNNRSSKQSSSAAVSNSSSSSSKDQKSNRKSTSTSK